LQLLQQPDTPLVIDPVEPTFKLVPLGIDLRDQGAGLERTSGGIEREPTGLGDARRGYDALLQVGLGRLQFGRVAFGVLLLLVSLGNQYLDLLRFFLDRGYEVSASMRMISAMTD
jgi:hypothetical protein